MINKQLTALALLTVTSLAGATLSVTSVSAQSNNGCGNVVKNIELKDSQNQSVFCSDGGNVKDLGAFGINATNVSVQSGKWTFYQGKNFKGKSVTVEGEIFQSLGFKGVGSFKKPG
ncbi:MAG: hypothetical protein V7L29_18365 [Nostoc sp.]|uniref:hypothetical protein n=1 Tax=Nostoc sp. TaxID=1180 RepID=UPI002FF06C6B